MPGEHDLVGRKLAEPGVGRLERVVRPDVSRGVDVELGERFERCVETLSASR
jgi:hypothetical protein